MKGAFYQITRDLHLYLGLFISPFILVFACSVFFLTHAWLPRWGPEVATTRVVGPLALPENLGTLSGRPRVDALREPLAAARVPGELGFIRPLVKENRLLIPVTIPGRETIVDLDLSNRMATVTTRETGLADALVTLHKSPGQHGPDLRMNWVVMRIWRWLADATVYLTLFISVSGVYLWYVLRHERTIGTALLVVGAVAFLGTAYALAH